MSIDWKAKTALNTFVSEYWDRIPSQDDWTTEDIFGLAHAVAAWQREQDAKLVECTKPGCCTENGYCGKTAAARLIRGHAEKAVECD